MAGMWRGAARNGGADHGRTINFYRALRDACGGAAFSVGARGGISIGGALGSVEVPAVVCSWVDGRRLVFLMCVFHDLGKVITTIADIFGGRLLRGTVGVM